MIHFLEEHLYQVQEKPFQELDHPWFANFTSYIVGQIILTHLTYKQRKFLSDVKHYVWEDQFLYRIYAYLVVQ